MAFRRKYNSATHVYLPVVKRAVVDFAVGADWTPVAGDVKVSKDGGAAANVATLPVAIAMGNGAVWDFALSAAETSAAKVIVTVVDAATKAVEDQAFVVETYGNASAELPPDLSDAVKLGLTNLGYLVQTVANTVDANVKAINDQTAAAAALDRSARAIVRGTVGNASTTTSIVTSSLDPAASVADQFKGRVVIYDRSTTTSGLRGQATDITASSAAGVLTVSALTDAPVSGDTFTIV